MAATKVHEAPISNRIKDGNTATLESMLSLLRSDGVRGEET